MKLVSKVLGISLLSLGLFLAVPAEAQDRPAARAGPRVIRLEEITIEGQIQKPNAFYVLQRSNLGFEVLELRTSFVEEIVRTVRSEPF